MTRALVVGGGISGLAAARGLARAGLDVTVLEASDRWGGKLAPVRVGGLRLDGGAESMLARRPEAVGLAADLGLSVVHPTPATPRIWSRGAEVPVPRSALGVPADLDALAPLLSSAGLARARVEPDCPAPPLTGDVAVGALVADRFGPEVAARLLEPILGGIYAGRSAELSFAAVNPGLFARARGGGALSGHARDLVAAAPPGPVFAGVPGGLHTLVDALVADLQDRGVDLRPRQPVRTVRRDGRGWRLVTGPEPWPEEVEADVLLLAVPARPAGRLLAGLVPGVERLVRLPYASAAVVTLLVSGLEPATSGLLVPPGELPTVKALTYSSAKWDWVRDLAPGLTVVRASVGRVGEERTLQVNDAALLARTYAEVRGLPGWGGAGLVDGAVTRWGGSLAQYLVGHADLTADLDAAVAGVPGLAVCGAYLDGVGIAACVSAAEAAVAKITVGLSAGWGRMGT